MFILRIQIEKLLIILIQTRIKKMSRYLHYSLVWHIHIFYVLMFVPFNTKRLNTESQVITVDKSLNIRKS